MQAVFAISTNSVQFYSILERFTSEFIYIVDIIVDAIP